MNVLSLFDGISCGRIALERANIKVDNYYASEIDKYAIQIAKKNYPDTKHIGSAVDVKASNLPKIDLLIGGSPCQGFSFAGKQLNFEDERSKLFFEYARLLEECKPKYFLLENVKMNKESIKVITNYLGVEPILINSNLVSAQNRPRLYWTNIPNIIQPNDKGILLKDILEKEFDIDYVENFKNCVRKNIINIEIYNYLKESGFAQIPSKSGFQDHKIGIFKSPCLRANNSFCLAETSSKGIRKLKPIEFERLQTVPDNYTAGVSDTQRYKMLGNGWTVDMIAHILKGLI
jgi:DNA (cytosine-5)-methyltransferase 3A